MPVFYACQRCTACCRWPGQVHIRGKEIRAMAQLLGMGERAFIQQYTRLNQARTGLTLEERSSGECVFLDGQDCRVQDAKPQQCRDFPNLWRFPGFLAQCHAVPIEVDEEEYRRRVLEATGRLPETL